MYSLLTDLSNSIFFQYIKFSTFSYFIKKKKKNYVCWILRICFIFLINLLIKAKENQLIIGVIEYTIFFLWNFNKQFIKSMLLLIKIEL